MLRIRFTPALLLGLCLLVAINLCQAAAPAFPEVMFILDGSGSMWGRIGEETRRVGQETKRVGEETKIEVARRVMAHIVPALPGEVKVGLTVYGHREKGNCNDVEILIPAGSDDRDALLEAVQGINPKGKTPIARSIQMVTETLKSKEEETTIILVSDGKETCDDDPCGAVAALKSTGIKFVLHVVGFGVGEAEQEQLACLAQAGGGTYFGAEDADALLAAMESVKEDVTRQVEQAKTKTVKAVSKIGKLALNMPAAGKISIAAVTIVRTTDGKVVKKASSPEANSLHPLMAGEYEIVMGFANPNYKDPTEVSYGIWEVKGGETTEVNLGTVAFNIAASLSKMPAETVTLTAASGAPLVTLHSHGNGYYLFKPKPVPAGDYHFSITYYRSPAPTVVSRDVHVSAGKETVVTLNSGIKVKPPEAGGVKGWDLIPAGHTD
ncbi:MAG: VWA domain-containing protein, partial [Candidatus Eisenbacteria sp.]|nr:VWA domain-containing protein [Candidatus Eisenbacteria bacterium]